MQMSREGFEQSLLYDGGILILVALSLSPLSPTGRFSAPAKMTRSSIVLFSLKQQ